MSLFCERCTNEDPKYFVFHIGHPQCRRCIGYYGQEGQSLDISHDVQSAFKFKLTAKQEALSKKVYEASTQGNVLVHAVCGAGKTELMVYALSQYLSQGKKVGIVIARRQVVLELTERFRKIFSNLVITPVCEGHTENLSGHLIISTSHQLFRFHKHFDVLFVDEPDAFPFSSDFVLQGFAKQAVVGNSVYLSATPNDWVIKNVATSLILNRRPHGFDLPVPTLLVYPLLFQIRYLLKYRAKTQKSILVFVPSIALGKKLSWFLKLPFVYAGIQDLDEKLKQFRDHQTQVLLTTTLLERGVTFYGVQVVVIEANHPVFSKSTLIQIAGRVGRDPKDPSGDVIFLCSKKSKILTQAIQDIQSANIA